MTIYRCDEEQTHIAESAAGQVMDLLDGTLVEPSCVCNVNEPSLHQVIVTVIVAGVPLRLDGCRDEDSEEINWLGVTDPDEGSRHDLDDFLHVLLDAIVGDIGAIREEEAHQAMMGAMRVERAQYGLDALNASARVAITELQAEAAVQRTSGVTNGGEWTGDDCPLKQRHDQLLAAAGSLETSLRYFTEASI